MKVLYQFSNPWTMLTSSGDMQVCSAVGGLFVFCIIRLKVNISEGFRARSSESRQRDHLSF